MMATESERRRREPEPIFITRSLTVGASPNTILQWLIDYVSQPWENRVLACDRQIGERQPLRWEMHAISEWGQTTVVVEPFAVAVGMLDITRVITYCNARYAIDALTHEYLTLSLKDAFPLPPTEAEQQATPGRPYSAAKEERLQIIRQWLKEKAKGTKKKDFARRVKVSEREELGVHHKTLTRWEKDLRKEGLL